ncbi:MAG: hypothetical protein QME71_05055 [Dehalococcoidia bacterium]|nr:hypothetical protein [Dehalococcoidia bacterium]
MKLVPLLKFWEKRRKPEEEEDLLDELTEDALQFMKEQESEGLVEEDAEKESEKDEEEETETTDESTDSEGSPPARDDLLSVFLAAEEEYADTSALVSEVDEVSAAELLAELRGVARALNLPSARADAG